MLFTVKKILWLSKSLHSRNFSPVSDVTMLKAFSGLSKNSCKIIFIVSFNGVFVNKDLTSKLAIEFEFEFGVPSYRGLKCHKKVSI